MLKLFLAFLAAAKLGKIFTVAGTMVLSIFTYSFIYGWRYSLGFVILLFIHEMGHFVAARQKGLNVGVPTFIPFVGAWIELKDTPMNAETEAYIGFAGPLIGTLGALGVYYMSHYWEPGLLTALAYAGFFLNLFNLIPISPLDGGRITAILSPRVWLFGIPILIGVFVWHPSPILILVAILALPQVNKAIKYDPKAPENVAYYGTNLETKITYGTFYLGLSAFLAVMCYEMHRTLASMH